MNNNNMTSLSGEEQEGLEQPLLPQEETVEERRNRHGLSKWFSMTGLGSESSGRVLLTEDEVNAIIEEFAHEDERVVKTWSRTIVERFLQNYSWYFPQRDDPFAPSLEKAWAYYEHVTLPRRLVFREQTEVHNYRRADPGEQQQHTELYGLWTTPDKALSESWGIGVDLYFATLSYLSMIFLLAGFVNIPNIAYYASAAYSGDDGQNNLAWTLRGSAVCTDYEWVVCTDCLAGNFFTSTQDQIKYATYNNNSTILVKRSRCLGAQLPQGLINWCSLLMMIGMFFLLAIYLRAREIRFDADRVTCADYSVMVENPPRDAYDVREWRDFFMAFADKQVTAITIALDNEALLRKLIARRILRDKLRKSLPAIDIDDQDAVRFAVAGILREEPPKSCFGKLIDCTIMPILHLFDLFLPVDVIMNKLDIITEDIKELQTKQYNVSKVFVTFETEEGQRAALSALTAGKLDILVNNTSNVSPQAIFKGRVLHVAKPPEPSAVRWLDLSVNAVRKYVLAANNLLVTLALIALAGFVVEAARQAYGARITGPLVTFFNIIIPMILRLLMVVERHSSEGDFQASLYLKITLFRWMNTAVLPRLITPFKRTIGDLRLDLLPTINSILRAELWITPIVAILDIPSNIRKHVLGPRSTTQEEMNLNFNGSPYNMGERYTAMTKILFLCFFYSALQPLVFFYGAVILFLQYAVDKFRLMRLWSWAPAIGPEVAIYSRRYFFSAALLVFAIVSSYSYAQSPYDNICDPDAGAERGVAGFYPGAVALNGETINITVTQNTSVVYCSQTWRAIKGLGFPAVPRIQPAGARWMTPSQETTTRIYGWTSVVVLAVFLATLFAGAAYRFFISFFRGIYKPDRLNQRIDLSNVTDILGYVPQISNRGFAFPFIACNIDEVHMSLIGWEDPKHNYDHHNLIFDVPYPGMHRERRAKDDPTMPFLPAEQQSNLCAERPIFAVMKHWLPAWQREALMSSAE